MARALRPENDTLYRAVILAPGGKVVGVYGPYDTVGVARRMVTQETTGWHQSKGYTGRVESAPVEWVSFPTEPAPAPVTPAQPLHTFTPWAKTPRLLRTVTITEKIDGTNAAIAVRPVDPAAAYVDDGGHLTTVGADMFKVFAQSRKRIITPDDDNAGFARWVYDNAGALAELLGAGLHFGEWWGQGIGRKYGMQHKVLSLFNTDKHAGVDYAMGSARVTTVPVLYQGLLDTERIALELSGLKAFGSVAAPDFMQPEGICVFHHASRQVFKVTLDAQDAGKWEAA